MPEGWLVVLIEDSSSCVSVLTLVLLVLLIMGNRRVGMSILWLPVP